MTHLHDPAALISVCDEPVAPNEDALSRGAASDEPVRSAGSPQSVAPSVAAGFVREPLRTARGIILGLLLSAALWIVIALVAWLLLGG